MKSMKRWRWWCLKAKVKQVNENVLRPTPLNSLACDATKSGENVLRWRAFHVFFLALCWTTLGQVEKHVALVFFEVFLLVILKFLKKAHLIPFFQNQMIQMWKCDSQRKKFSTTTEETLEHSSGTWAAVSGLLGVIPCTLRCTCCCGSSFSNQFQTCRCTDDQERWTCWARARSAFSPAWRRLYHNHFKLHTFSWRGSRLKWGLAVFPLYLKRHVLCVMECSLGNPEGGM